VPDDATTHTSPGIKPAEKSPLPESPPGYQLIDKIGQGGMGVVYRACDVALDRDVAVKLLSKHYPPDSLPAQRFLSEARITGQLQHPGIPAVHQVGAFADGRPFLAMKLIKGSTLEAILKLRADPSADLGRLLAIFEAVCQAVGYAHAHSVIHRDLKPANVMVGAFGEVQVMDWGLAKDLGEESTTTADALAAEQTRAWTQVSPTPELGSQTQHGSLVGTPAFIPPEQALGEIGKINERADVFGLGALLAVILTGMPPYVGESFESVRVQAARGKLEECYARLDACGAEPELIALCKKCLAFEPDERPPDAGAVARAVAELRSAAEERARTAERQQVAAAARSAERRKRRRLWIGAAATVAVAAVGGLLAVLAVQRRANAELAEKRRLAEDAQKEAEKQAKLAKEFGNSASQAYATLIGEVQDKMKDKPALQDLKKQILLPAIRGLESLIASMDDNKDAFNLHSLADAHLKMGWLYREIGQIDQAYKQFQETHKIRERIALADPNEEDARVQLANSWKDLGDIVLYAKGDASRAREDYQRGLALANDLAEHPKSEQPSLMARKQVVADLYYKLGDIANGPVEAREYYTQALVRRQEWSNAHPELADPITRIADCYHDLARASFHSGDLKAAHSYFEECLKLREEFFKRQPQSVYAKLILAFEHERVGDFQVREGRPEQGKDSLLNALARYDELVKADPKNEENKKHLSRATYLLGTAYLRLHKTKVAEENYAKALEMRRELAEKDSANFPKQKDYMVNLARCGFHEAASKKAEGIHKKSPKDVDTLLNLMRCYALCSAAVRSSATPDAEQAKLRDTYASSAANCLEQAIANGCRNVVDVETDSDIDAIRNYPAFQRALAILRESVQLAVTGTTPSARAPK
jgi:tetratricopeptide (TPR) repeat protein/tRNA A-37 threonylcarbamoyl transferase component Bud32